jgi:hypothetical protein
MASKGLLMSGKSIVIAIAACGWLVAALFAFVAVVHTGFFGIGVIGLVFWFVCTRIELEKDAPVGGAFDTSLMASQVKAQSERSRAERAAAREANSLAVQSARFFKHIGIGLVLIGFGGFAYFQF